jgi:hypothetical protein
LPDTNGLTLDGVFTAESTGVTSVLRDFHLLNLLTQRRTVTGTVFTGDSDLTSAFGLQQQQQQQQQHN